MKELFALYIPLFSHFFLGSCAELLPSEENLEPTDCQIQCPRDSDPSKMVLPALSQAITSSGTVENTLECWRIDNVLTKIPDIDNAIRLDWEDGFDAVYQYVFDNPSFMPAHPAPEPSLIIMSSGIG
jgi:hypothetical protein